MKTFILTISLVALCFSTALPQQYRCPYTISGNTIQNPVPSAGGVYYFNINLSGLCAIIPHPRTYIYCGFFITSPPWIQCSPTNGVGYHLITVTVFQNNSDTVRTDNIHINVCGSQPRDISVTQSAPPVGPLSCEDISGFQARCQPGGLLQARVVLTDTSHTGAIVEFVIDEALHEVTVGSNGKAQFSQTGFSPGIHNAELIDPPGCFPSTTVTCSPGLDKDAGDVWDNDASVDLPVTAALFENYPNPFNPSTTIRYALSEDAHVLLRVYNMLGQIVKTLVDENQLAGYQQIVWNGSNDFGQNVASGMYYYRVTAGNLTATKRMLLLK